MTLTAPTLAPVNYGEVFTRRWVVETLLDLTGYTPELDLANLRIVEPACGSGAFLGPIVERLIRSAKHHNHPLHTLHHAIRAYDLQPEHVSTSRALCERLLIEHGAPPETAATTSSAWVNHADFLLPGVDDTPAHIVVGNPPYIRYDDLPPALAATYRKAWPAMTGRGDIYIGFIERALRMLAPGGKVGFICADRWMRNQYGSGLRKLVGSHFAVEHVWTMHDVDAFEAEVSAYPAITVIANKRQGAAIVAETDNTFNASSAAALIRDTRGPAATFNGPGVKAHRLPHWFSPDELWPTGPPARLALIEHLADNFPPLHDTGTGTKVSIGVATGADKTYITTNPDAAEPDRMLPLAMRHDLATGHYQWQGHYLINPWADDGTLVPVDDYPKMAAHLASDPAVRNRFVARKAPHRWHRTIDKVQADLTPRPKLLLQDMRATIHPVLEPGGHYPHHNLYYVISDTWDMEVLGGLLLSRIAQAFIEAYCVRMRGGTLRFQAQYLKRIRVPRPEKVNAGTAEALRQAFRRRDRDAATAAAANAYNINPQDYDLA